MKIIHDSDCAVHNEPAYPNGPCDCGVEPAPKPMTDFDIRGKLSALKCWHRLSGDEVQDLIEFFGGSRMNHV